MENVVFLIIGVLILAVLAAVHAPPIIIIAYLAGLAIGGVPWLMGWL